MHVFFGDPPIIIFLSTFSTFSILFFSGIWIDTLWTQFILEFTTDHFETMHTYST